MSIPEWFYIEHESKAIELSHACRDKVLSELDHIEAEIKDGCKEQDVQRFLKKRPYLMAGKYRSGHGTYAFSELSFGGKYYADWVTASGHSGGIMWELIELECPQSCPFNKDGDFSQATRKGIKQIKDWRDWVRRNLDMAERPPSRDGLGLFDIRSLTPGIVVVGQNSTYKDLIGVEKFNDHRKTLYEESFMKIISYESFFNQLRVEYSKPPFAQEFF